MSFFMPMFAAGAFGMKVSGAARHVSDFEDDLLEPRSELMSAISAMTQLLPPWLMRDGIFGLEFRTAF